MQEIRRAVKKRRKKPKSLVFKKPFSHFEPLRLAALSRRSLKKGPKTRGVDV
jgi:hypothetical protein